MALLNGIYVFVTDEEISRDIDSTTHPVETGIEISSTIRRKPIEISIQGKIVDYENMTASDILSKIYELQKSGSLIDYKGRNTGQNLQIQSFDTTHPNTNAGGADFSMTLKEVRIAKSAYNKQSSANKTSSSDKNNPDLTVGGIVVFTGGSVYVSSDATKAAANRGRSTCKITIINTRSWAKHPYHLISTDGKMVYGWVDRANIEGIVSNDLTPTSNGGTQQSQTGDGTAIYHNVKKGETLWGLSKVTYKKYGVSVNELLKNNPSAFSRAGDVTTLQIGAKLFIANR